MIHHLPGVRATSAVALLLIAGLVRGQDAGATLARLRELVTEERVREVVGWIASDERGGRDSPSPGLEETADYIGERFAAAGLEQLVLGAWRHRYTLPGTEIDSKKLRATLTVSRDGAEVRRVELQGDVDVRIQRMGAVHTGSEQTAVVARFGDARVERLLGAGGGRRPIVLELPSDHAQWLAAGGRQQSLARQLAGSGPVLLLRQGVLEAGDFDGTSFQLAWQAEGVSAVDVPLSNVVGVLRGSEAPDEYVVVSAHYDHISGRPIDGDAIYNGADDDATGSTAVVLLAGALAQLPRPRRSVVFVCFSAEEKGLRGSARFVEDDVLPVDAIQANVNIEMIGRPPAEGQLKAWITGREYSDFAAAVAPALQRAGIELIEFGMARQLFAASDNLSFVRRGVVAHSISAGSLHADYHQPSDEVAALDIAHMTAVIVGLGEVVLDLANRPDRLQFNADGQAVVERLQQRRR